MAKQLGVSVVICTYKGEKKLPECLFALEEQSFDGPLEIIIVNDDPAGEVIIDNRLTIKVRVINNLKNLGPAGSRNVGVRAAKQPLVFFTDDDCRPEPNWIAALHSALVADPAVVAVGGKTVPHLSTNYLFRYLGINNPMDPLELGIEAKRSSLSRLADYLKGQFSQKSSSNDDANRVVYSLGSANLALRKTTMLEQDLFDETFEFSGEDQDLCRRLNQSHPRGLVHVPAAIVLHEYKAELNDTLRRSRAYARGNTSLRRKYPELGRIVFPIPVLWLVAMAASATYAPALLWLPTVLIPLAYPRYLRLINGARPLEPILYSYVNFLQDVWANYGFLESEFSKHKVEPS